MESRLAGEGGAAAGPSGAASPAAGTAAPGAAVSLFGNDRPPRPGPGAEDVAAILTLDRVRQEWPRVVEEAKARAASLGAFLAPARPVLLGDDSLTLAFPPSSSFHRSQCEEEGRRRSLESALAQVLGRRLAVRFDTAVEEPAAEEPAQVRGAGGGAGPPAGPGELDRPTHDEIERLAEAPAVKALEKEFRVRMVRAGRRRPDAAVAGRGDAEGATGEATE
jgi:hypothetical protein